MADRNWWFNSAGATAPVSNPGSAVPNYGLTMDVATAGWEPGTDFAALAEALQMATAQVQSKFATMFTPAANNVPQDETWWDKAKGAAGAVGNVTAGALGAVEVGLDKVGLDVTEGARLDELEAMADEQGLDGWDRLKAIGKADFGNAMQELQDDPETGKLLETMDTVTKYASVPFLAASMNEEDVPGFLMGRRWGDARDMAFEQGWNPGQAFAAMFYDGEVLDDAERMEKIRQHNTLFNVSALAFNTIAAWKYDPTVLAGKAAGKVGDVRAGRLATDGRSMEVQRDILTAETREAAAERASGYTGIGDRVRAGRALSLFDKAQQLRTAAQTMGFEDFKNLSPFQTSASGTVMAKLFKDVADSDADWNLVFRTSIGDPDAVAEIAARRGEVADKIVAIEGRSLPRMEAELDRLEKRYQARIAEQGGKPGRDDKIMLTGYNDWILDADVQTLRAEVDTMRGKLSTYQSQESWLQRTLPGLDLETDAVNNRVANSVFGNLEQVAVGNQALRQAGRGARDTLYSLGGKVSTWQHDEFSPVTRVMRAPAKPFLKRTGVVSLNDVDDGAGAVQAYLDQIAYVVGRGDQGVRDDILARWSGSRTDVERKDIVDELERQGIAMLGRKYGLNAEVMEQVADELQRRRGVQWSKMADRSMYTTVRDPKTGKRLDLLDVPDEHGNVNQIRMPMDPSELPNWRPLTNLTDLDKTLRQHADLYREFSTLRERGLWAEREANRLYDTVGETLNAFWKPMALISLRWPARVVADESFRIMLMMGVLPHMKAWGEGAKNTVYNNGLVRPREWWMGREVRTKSLVEDTLRVTGHQFDPYDYRQAVNPTGAVPARVLDFDQIDQKRYRRLNEAVSERKAETRSLGYYKGAVKPKWMQRWDDRLAAAETSDAKGFHFDPVTGKAVNKGFAVSVYPGKMRTFAKRPTARDLNQWMEDNSDLLAVRGNRAAVWLDKESGRWHMDVVKTPKRREDAMRLAADAEATEFYDIEDGFTRFMSEENYYQHLPSAFETGGFDRITTQQVDIPEAYADAGARKGVGFGKRKWRTKDGRTVEGEGIYGTDKRDPNIYYSATSSQGAFQGILGGHTRGLGQNRAKRTSRSYQSFDPGDGPNTPEAKLWAENWTHYVNNHIRQSPIWLRMLNGQTDDQIEAWLRSKGGRDLRQRMGPRGADPHKWVGEMRAIFDHTLPTAEARRAALVGEVDPGKVDDILPHELRNDVHGQTIELTAGVQEFQGKWFKFVDTMYKHLGSMPTDALVRHPFAANVYDMRLKNYLASVPADKIDDKVMAAAEASARAFAVKQTRRLLYNIADEVEGVHMLRFLSPFFQAQLEVLERYAHIWTRKPESLARTLLVFNESQTAQVPGIFQVVNQDGEPVTESEYDRDNQVVLQVTPFMRKIANRIPGLQGALDNAGSMTIPVASMNLILQGENPLLPSAGPLVAIPASEFYFRDHPIAADEKSFEGAVYRWLYPFGVPDGGSALSRTGKALSPAWLRRMYTAVQADFNDSAFANRANIIYQDMYLRWEKDGRQGRPPTEEQALEAAKNEYMIRALSSFALPVPLTPQSPHKFWIDQGRIYREKYGIEAQDRFYEDFGADMFAFFTEASKSTNGMAPTSKQFKGYSANKRLINEAPDLAGILSGPFGWTGEFNDAVYQWQLETRRSPLSKTNMREIKDPAERIKDVQIDRGWIEYNKLSAAVDVELRRRGLTSLENNGAEDLKYWRDQEVETIIGRNPAWSDAYQSREQDLGGWLQQAYKVAFDGALDGRTDIEGLRAYLISRAKLQDALQERQATGQVESDSLSATDNADLKAGWDSYTRELVSSNLLFAEIYHRYLDNDDLSVFIAP